MMIPVFLQFLPMISQALLGPRTYVDQELKVETGRWRRVFLLCSIFLK